MARPKQHGVVRRVVAGGREADLRIGLAMCEEVLAARDGNTSAAWTSLAVRARQVQAAITRMENAEGSHRSSGRRRPPRPPRFLRSLPNAAREGVESLTRSGSSPVSPAGGE